MCQWSMTSLVCPATFFGKVWMPSPTDGVLCANFKSQAIYDMGRQILQNSIVCDSDAVMYIR